MEPLEQRRQQQRGSHESGALRSHELGPVQVDAAWLFMRVGAKGACARGSRSPGSGERAGLGAGSCLVKGKPEALEGDASTCPGSPFVLQVEKDAP